MCQVKNAAGSDVPPVIEERYPDTPAVKRCATGGRRSEPFALHIWGQAEGVPFSVDVWTDMRIVSD